MNISYNEDRMNKSDGRFERFEKRMKKSIRELNQTDKVILDEVERVHEIMVKRTDELSRKIG